jgi:peptide/nickel transport system permease protein
MLTFIARRLLFMVVTLLVVSVIAFTIIELPPGDYLDAYVSNLLSQGAAVDPAQIAALKSYYGLDSPTYVRYFKWMRGLSHGDFGRSLQWSQPVIKLIGERLPWSLFISFSGLIVVYLIGIPVGVYSATHQYSIGDYCFTFISFIGVGMPTFLIALICLWIYFLATGDAAVGLFSKQYVSAAWSFGKFFDLLKHLWLPALITGVTGTAGLIRTMRANMLDELQKPYVVVARAKGLTEARILYKYPFRIAINPIISTVGWTLPGLVNGELLTSMVLGLPTIAPIFLDSLMSQDMFLAGSIVFILSGLTIVGTFISDLLLAWVDPRIRGTY